MSALERLSSYSAKKSPAQTAKVPSVFDVTTPEGAFLAGVHLKGFSMYKRKFLLRDELLLSEDAYSALSEEEQSCYDASMELSESDYFSLSDEDKSKYIESVEYSELYKVLTTAGNQVINAVAGSGKALWRGTKVYTSVGFVSIGELQVGDEVLGTDGKFHKVLGVYPQGRKEYYSFVFDYDCSNAINACEEHLWAFHVDGKDEIKVLNSEQALNYLGSHDLELPVCEPVEFDYCGYIEAMRDGENVRLYTDKKLYFEYDGNKEYISPYALGVLTSPGDFQDFVVENVISEYADIFGENGNDCYFKATSLISEFFETRVFPDFVFTSSISFRKELLRGIFDACGYYELFEDEALRDEYCDEDAPQYNSLVTSLIEDSCVDKGYSKWVATIAESVGVCARLRDIGVSDEYWCFTFTDKSGVFVSEDNPFRAYLSEVDANSYRRTVTGIEYMDDAWAYGIDDEELDDNDQIEMVCIEVDSSDHLFITEGYIPTHNTTALVLKILHDIVTGEAVTMKAVPGGNTVRVVNNMWVCTFLRSGAAELESALSSWQRTLGYSQTANQIAFSTMDAEFKRCLNAMGCETPIGDASKLSGLFKKAVDACNITRDGYALNKEDYNIINGIVVYFRGRLDAKRYQHPNCADYGITPTILDLLVHQYANLRKASGVMDFEEVMELLYKFLYVTPNAAVQDFVANRYNFIYVDEFQDTSQMAYAILKFYGRGKLWLNRSGLGATGDEAQGMYTGVETLGKFVAVGDPSQCIYSFRGSDSKVLTEFIDNDFRPVLSTLSVNWRCPANILNPVVPSIHINYDSASQEIIPAKEGGEFAAYVFPNFKSMLKQLKDSLKEDMASSRSVAILCRTNFDGMIPAFVLESEKEFDFSISGDNMTLSSPLPKKIIGVSSLFTERSTPAVKTALEFFSGRGSAWAIKQLMEVLKQNGKNIWQLPEEDIKYSCPTVLPFVQMVKKVLMPDGVNRDKTKEVEALRLVYSYMIINTFGGDSAYCASARAYLETLLYIMEERDFKTIYDFLEEVDYLNDRLHGRIKRSKAQIKIATVHEFKGKESDSVYVWNDSEGVFPSNKCDEDDEEQLNEERRVHYIACTRARQREHIYTLGGRVGKFVKEMELALESPKTIGVSLSKQEE